MTGVQAVKEKAGLPATTKSEPNNAPSRHEDWLVKYQHEIARALPSHMTADRMARIALTELRRVPALLDCDPRSFFGCVIQAAQLGLEPGAGLGHCFLIPLRNKKSGRMECNLWLGVRGMIDLARRSGNIISISARPVFARDEFRYAYGIYEKLEHVPTTDPNAGELVFVYAVARLRDGGVQFEVMSKAQVDKIRARSMAANSGPWVTDYVEMARKTVIRRLWKYLPTSVEMVRAQQLDDALDEGSPQYNESLLTGEAPPPPDVEQPTTSEAADVVDAAGESKPSEPNAEPFELGEGKK